MGSDIAIEFRNVSKIYKLKRKDKQVQKEEKTQYFYALKDISFTVKKGQVVGILGTNGSGKSTMALVLSGIASPNEGEIEVNGEQALVAINTGLNSQLTGLENIELKGALLGLNQKHVQEIVDGVIEFAEIGDFLYQPVKKYSSGMKSRLGFSISINISPDILIIDEALSVGDPTFTQKCLDKMYEFRDSGRTIFFVSHSLEQMKQFCKKIIWLEYGRMRAYGPVRDVIPEYYKFVVGFNSMSQQEKDEYKAKRLKNWEK